MNKSKINEYFDTEDLKGKEEINFIKGDTKKELTKIVSKDVKNSNPREKVYYSLIFNNPFIKKLDILHGKISNKGLVRIEKEIKVNDKRFSAISEIKINVVLNKDGSFSTSTQCEVKVSDTDKDLKYKKVYEKSFNKDIKDIKDLNTLFSSEIYSLVKEWNKWTYRYTGKDILNDEEIEFKDDKFNDKHSGGNFKLENDPNFNPQFNSHSYILKDYENFIKESKRSK
jgi:hypothetical protein